MSVATGSREARVHTQPSNRANAALSKGKAKESDERRVVYKPVLENPYQVKWPSTPLNVQNSILACLADLLPEVAEYHLARQTASRKRKTEASLAKRQAKAQKSKASQQPATSSKNSKKRVREDDDTSDTKRAKVSHDSTTEEAPGPELPSSGSKKNSGAGTGKPGDSIDSTKRAKESRDAAGSDRTNTEHEPTVESVPQITSTLAILPIPPLLKHCTFGINEVTKRLEALAKPSLTAEIRSASRPRLRAVLVCRSDIDPPLLIAHFPILVATSNSSLPADSSDDKYVKLVALPMRAEHTLAEVTGLRRVAVMALDAETPGLERLEPLLSSVPVLRETWLAPPSSITHESKVLVPTHVKQLKTTAPKDMKAAKEKRKRELGEARERAKEDESRGKKRRKLAPNAKANVVLTDNADS
ncbi:hypothetical protein FRC08_003623 [Ceratobasidium sp. 394]|nr:hypothetical protein FRC08_003623 [Ceratobasidium sp. 394]